MNASKWSRIFALVLAIAMGGAAAVEAVHWFYYGHVAPYGLHVDIVGIKRDGHSEYAARLFNYSFLPRKIQVLVDTRYQPGSCEGNLILGCQVEVRSPSTWIASSRFEPNIATELIQHVVLWPATSRCAGWIELTPEGGVKQGDTVRIVVVPVFHPTSEREQYYSEAFVVR